MDTTPALSLNDLTEIPLLDVHTHIDASHLSARGLHDILLYHMVVSDLYSAGCPSGHRLTEAPTDQEAEERIVEAIPFLPIVQNTSSCWGMRTILEDLYDWHDPISLRNWRKLDQRIRDSASTAEWPLQILRKARIHRVVTELWRGRSGSADEILQYSLEWAFFTRAQWGQNDIPLLELEKAWNEPHPSPPLPVTLSEYPRFSKRLKSLDDIHTAIDHYCSLIPYEKILSTAQHLSTHIHYRPVGDAQMVDALRRRASAGVEERDIYGSYILERFLSALESQAPKLVYQFSFGAEPLPFETGSFLRSETLMDLASIIARHPGVKFQVFLSSAHANQGVCTLARELPNFSVAGYWWHNFFPAFIRRIIAERLDMVPLNKQIGFFSDAYCVDWAYAKAHMVRHQFAHVLNEKIAQGQYTPQQAIQIMRQVCYHTPQSLLGVMPCNVLAK